MAALQFFYLVFTMILIPQRPYGRRYGYPIDFEVYMRDACAPRTEVAAGTDDGIMLSGTAVLVIYVRVCG